MSAPHPGNEYERYLLLADREACDEQLTPDERAFCRAFELRHAPKRLGQSGEIPAGSNAQAYLPATHELAMYSELADMNRAPDDASRALVDRALARLDAEEAARKSDELNEIDLLRRSRRPGWAAWVTVAGFAMGALYAVLDRTGAMGTHPAASAPIARAELVYASGSVNVSDAAGTAGRTLLAAGSVIETQTGGACVLIDNDINVCLAPKSRMRLTNIAGPARVIDLEVGKLATRLSTQPEGMSLTIMAGGVASTAVGTAFSVERVADSAAAVGGNSNNSNEAQSVVTTVLNGKVRVGRHAPGLQGDSVIVNAHERSVSESRGPTARPTVTSVRRTEEAPSWALLGPTVLWHDPVAATLEVHGDPTGAEAWLDDQWLGSTPVSSLIPVGEHRLTVRKDDHELLSRDLHVHAGDAQDIRYEGTQPAPTAQLRTREEAEDKPAGVHPRRGRVRDRQSHVAPEVDGPEIEQAEPESGAELLREARQAMRAGQFRGAAAVYEKLIDTHSGSEEALAALVALGQVRLNQLGDPRGALKSLDAYLRHGGALEEVARVARIDSLAKLHQDAAEQSAIEELLQRFPRSFETKRLRARLDTLRHAHAAVPNGP